MNIKQLVKQLNAAPYVYANFNKNRESIDISLDPDDATNCCITVWLTDGEFDCLDFSDGAQNGDPLVANKDEMSSAIAALNIIKQFI